MTQPSLVATPTATDKIRFNWVEVFRGFAILEVVLHHVSGRFLREFEMLSGPWVALALLNQTLHFAVPGFLFLTTIVLGTSLISSFDVKRYARNRVTKVLWPYVLWTAIYMAWRHFAMGAEVDLSRVPFNLILGKAYFHLYFLALSLQLTVLLPLLIPVLRRRPSFLAATLVGAVATLVFYWINKMWFQFPYIGSVLVWYVPSVSLGIWIAGRASEIDSIVARMWRWALVSFICSWLIFVPVAMNLLKGLHISSLHFQLGHWAYTSCATLLLLCVAVYSAKTRWGQVFKWIGTYSLQIYLIHPVMINLLDKFPNRIGGLPNGLQFFIYLTFCLGAPLALALWLKRNKLSEWVFGR